MSAKSGTNKAGVAPPSRHGTEPAYDLFDSLRKARSRSKELRQKSPSPADSQLQGGARQDDE